jgi:hypothetical protein
MVFHDKNISSIAYDQGRKRLLATSTNTVFESKDNGCTWHRGPDRYPLRRISVVRGPVGATPFDGGRSARKRSRVRLLAKSSN